MKQKKSKIIDQGPEAEVTVKWRRETKVLTKKRATKEKIADDPIGHLEEEATRDDQK